MFSNLAASIKQISFPDIVNVQKCVVRTLTMICIGSLYAFLPLLPVLVSARLYGAEEFVEDGKNGWVVERNVEGVRTGLLRILEDRCRMLEMASAAARSVTQYSQAAFSSRWHALYAGPLGAAAERVAACSIQVLESK